LTRVYSLHSISFWRIQPPWICHGAVELKPTPGL
jgi:hypothetical protein